MTDVSDTARRKSTLTRVLVAHDASASFEAICAALRDEYVVNECGIDDAMTALSAHTYRCVVFRVGGAARAEAIHAMVKAASWRSTPILFVVGVDASTDDISFLHTMGAHWVVDRTAAAEIAALVHAL
jgi:DNA-binding response OmpR family regulator